MKNSRFSRLVADADIIEYSLRTGSNASVISIVCSKQLEDSKSPLGVGQNGVDGDMDAVVPVHHWFLIACLMLLLHAESMHVAERSQRSSRFRGYLPAVWGRRVHLAQIWSRLSSAVTFYPS